jgi:hypothetical protein
MQKRSKNNAKSKESTQIAPFPAFFFSLYAVVGEAAISLRRRRLGGTWYPRRGLKRAKNGPSSTDRSRQRPHRSPVLALTSGVPQRSFTSGKKWPFDLHFAQDT